MPGMCDNKFPSHHEFRQAILSMLRECPDGMKIEEMDRKLVQTLKIADSLAVQIHEGKRTEVSYRSAWARSQLKKRGLITKNNYGVFVIASNP